MISKIDLTNGRLCKIVLSCLIVFCKLGYLLEQWNKYFRSFRFSVRNGTLCQWGISQGSWGEYAWEENTSRAVCCNFIFQINVNFSENFLKYTKFAQHWPLTAYSVIIKWPVIKVRRSIERVFNIRTKLCFLRISSPPTMAAQLNGRSSSRSSPLSWTQNCGTATVSTSRPSSRTAATDRVFSRTKSNSCQSPFP